MICVRFHQYDVLVATRLLFPDCETVCIFNILLFITSSSSVARDIIIIIIIIIIIQWRRQDLMRGAPQAYGPIFSRGLSHIARKNFSTTPDKNCYANLQNYCAQLTPHSNRPISKNPGFRGHFISLDRMNSVFRLINTCFSFLAVGFCPQNLAFARKVTALPESGGCIPQPPGSYAYEGHETKTK